MAFTPSSPLTGATVTGLTSPTYTLAADTAPTPESKQYYVSATGGTQTGVTTHSIASPFTMTMWRPAVAKVLAFFSSISGFRSRVERNKFRIMVRKGVTPIAGAPIEIMRINVEFDIPAGVDVNDLPNLRAAISSACGLMWNVADGVSTTVQTNTL